MKKAAEYIQGECPNCGSYNLDYGVMELVDQECFYPYRCKSCGFEGKEWYALKFLEHTEKGK